MQSLLENDRAVIGGNHPPPEPTPFDLSKQEIEELFMEAANWCDGTAVTTQLQCDAVGKLITDLRAAAKTADERRVVEKKPHDDASAAVQARYNPLIQKDKGKVDLAIASCKRAIAPFLKRLDDMKQAEIAEARRIADEKGRAAQEAFRQADLSNLSARAEAQNLDDEAKEAAVWAKQAEKINVKASGGGRAISLRTVYTPAISDAREAAGHYWKTRRGDMEAYLLGLAVSDVKSGARAIPGFTITETKEPV